MTDEYIRKQDVKDALQEKVFHNLTDEFYGAMQVLDELPSAQPEQKWIPCTPKTMPPYWVLVWVTDNHGHVAVCQLSHKENHYWYDGDERWMYEHDSIIAWMPYNVPEPYQAERREE